MAVVDGGLQVEWECGVGRVGREASLGAGKAGAT